MWIDVNDRTRVCLNSKTAEQLGTSTLGNENTPIYLNEGFPAECHRMLPLIAGENYKIEGPLGLTEKVMFDSELPETGFYGQLFFVEDDDIALPPGGSKNQVLTKKSQVDGDADWQTPKITWDINPNDSNTIKPKLLNIEGNAIPVATENNGGILTTSNQTLTGIKTFNTGELNILRNTSIADNLPATLLFKVKQTDNNITSTGSIKVYDDHDANAYGTSMVIQSNGNMIIGSGESPYSCYETDLINSASEDMYITSDNNIYFYTNCNTYTNKKTEVYIDNTGALYGAVWNDYAEYRNQIEEIEPGYCVTSLDNGQVFKTTKKLQNCDGIVSDTFGFSIGKTNECKTPLAVAGRVLAYCEGNKYSYHSGDVVCAGPKGKVRKMSRREIRKWPDRIVGVVSEIPEYETWGSNNIKVNGRIWIKVK